MPQAKTKGSFANASDIAKWRLCVGCGACVYACQEDKLKLVDFIDHGLRPVYEGGGECASCSDCIDVCPGIGIGTAETNDNASPKPIGELVDSWGPVLEIWEGHAADPEIRFAGSSGGLASALSLFCLEKMAMYGVVHVGHDKNVRYSNRSVISHTREEILSATGSRYSPGSPCDQLKSIEDAAAPCVFIGKPCDVEGLRKAQAIRPRLDQNMGIAIAIFCAGTPSTRGTLDLLAQHDIKPAEVEEVRYRGRGWPGEFSVRLVGDSEWTKVATYQAAWGFLQKYRPYRCHLCPDGTGEFADVSCGDPWYREIEEGEVGKSLVLVRTEKGRTIVRQAMQAGYVELEQVRPEVLDLSQRDLQLKRGAIWGRVLTMRSLGIPAPHFRGFSLFRNWLRIPLGHKVRSLFGTARRIVGRRYNKPIQMN